MTKITSLMDHQEDPVAFGERLFSEGRNVYYACAAGLGKTVIAAWLLQKVGADNIVVCCPKILIKTWEEALNGSINGYKPKNVHVTTYTSLEKFAKAASFKPEYFIADEAHYLSNPKAKRTQMFFQLQRGLGIKTIYLSATPYERPIQFWPVFEKEHKPKVGYLTYIKRYCAAYKGPHGWITSGASNIEELARLSSDFCYILNEKVLDLPDLSHEVIVVPATKKIKDAEKKMAPVLKGLDLKKMIDGHDGIYPFDTYAELRKWSGEEKIPAVLEFLKATYDGKPTIIFAHHRIVIETLHEKLKNSATVYGGNSYKKNIRNLELFTEGKLDYIILSLTSAVEGLTLVNSTRAIFAEIPLTAKSFYQAKKRLHRIGQDKAVNIQLIAMSGTFDDKVARVLVDKHRTLERFGILE